MSTYSEASRKSYEGQLGFFSTGVSSTGSTEVPLGFQPFGISSFGNRIAVADYFGPAVMFAEVSLEDKVLKLRDISWIRGTMSGQDPARMFPDVFQPGGANRLQNVLILGEDRLALTRNGDRRIFHIRRMEDGKWHHVGEQIVPTGAHPLLHSILHEEGILLTTESDGSLENWVRCEYRVGEDIVLSSDTPMPPYHYLGCRGRDGWLYSVSDVRAGESEGVYVGGYPSAKPVYRGGGNGIVLLNGGKDGALMTRYGQAYPGPFNGRPGSLVYLPPSCL